MEALAQPSLDSLIISRVILDHSSDMEEICDAVLRELDLLACERPSRVMAALTTEMACYRADFDGKAVGFASVRDISRNEVAGSVSAQGTEGELSMIGRLFVAEQVRGCSIGSLLLRAVEEDMTADGKAWLLVNTYPARQRFYERRGYDYLGVVGQYVQLRKRLTCRR